MYTSLLAGKLLGPSKAQHAPAHMHTQAALLREAMAVSLAEKALNKKREEVGGKRNDKLPLFVPVWQGCFVEAGVCVCFAAGMCCNVRSAAP